MEANRSRRNQIKIYLSEEELEMLESLCVDNETTKSKYIRELITLEYKSNN